MAEGDTRIETLEGEPKVLKGEVRRTLVDLRALLMREDSPLNERALARHLAAMPSEGGEPQATAPAAPKEAPQVVQPEAPKPVAPAPEPPAPVAPPAAPVPAPVAVAPPPGPHG